MINDRYVNAKYGSPGFSTCVVSSGGVSPSGRTGVSDSVTSIANVPNLQKQTSTLLRTAQRKVLSTI